MQDPHNILALLDSPEFQQKRIVVIGDVMLDRYIWGDVSRISPEAPVPVLHHTHRTSVAGGAANVVMNLAGLGLHATLCGYWGNDPERAELESLLAAAGVQHSGLVLSDNPTITKTRVVARRQQIIRLDVESTEPHDIDETRQLDQVVRELTSTADAIILSDYAKGTLTRELCQQTIQQARAQKILVLVDPKDRDFSKYAGATAICPNLGELSQATGVPIANFDELLARGQQLARDTNVDFLAVTMSERGIAVLTLDKQIHSPARAREVFDVSGAGDTVIAVLAAALTGGLDIESAVALANTAAGIVVGKVGTAPIDRNELIAELTPSSSVGSADKILTRERLLLRAAEWRATGQRLVFTNGCFDLLHVGHITLLEKCRVFGDKVILGINTDAGVQRLKGPSRPIVNQNDRARVLSALASIDAVVFFDEDTPLNLIRELKPDVLVKGGDYSEATVVGAKEVRACGGRVEIIPTVEGFSTTGIINKMTGC